MPSEQYRSAKNFLLFGSGAFSLWVDFRRKIARKGGFSQIFPQLQKSPNGKFGKTGGPEKVGHSRRVLGVNLRVFFAGEVIDWLVATKKGFLRCVGPSPGGFFSVHITGCVLCEHYSYYVTLFFEWIYFH